MEIGYKWCFVPEDLSDTSYIESKQSLSKSGNFYLIAAPCHLKISSKSLRTKRVACCESIKIPLMRGTRGTVKSDVARRDCSPPRFSSSLLLVPATPTKSPGRGGRITRVDREMSFLEFSEPLHAVSDLMMDSTHVSKKSKAFSARFHLQVTRFHSALVSVYQVTCVHTVLLYDKLWKPNFTCVINY